MPYDIIHEAGIARPWKIVRKSDGVTVGRSATRAQAGRSIGYRMQSEGKSTVPGYVDGSGYFNIPKPIPKKR